MHLQKYAGHLDSRYTYDFAAISGLFDTAMPNSACRWWKVGTSRMRLRGRPCRHTSRPPPQEFLATYANVSRFFFVKANLVLVLVQSRTFWTVGQYSDPSSYWDNLRRARGEPSPVRVGLQFCSRKLPICPCFLAAVKIWVTFTFGLRAATGIQKNISYITYINTSYIHIYILHIYINMYIVYTNEKIYINIY